MRTTAIALIFPILLGCAAGAGAQENRPGDDRMPAGLEQHATKPPVIAQALQRISSTPDALRAPSRSAAARTPSRTTSRPSRHDSVWNGALIGAGVGAAGGYLWASNLCGSNDAECFSVAGPVGILSGAGIGAAVGAVLDALTK
jgi:hypothetical protein